MVNYDTGLVKKNKKIDKNKKHTKVDVFFNNRQIIKDNELNLKTNQKTLKSYCFYKTCKVLFCASLKNKNKKLKVYNNILKNRLITLNYCNYRTDNPEKKFKLSSKKKYKTKKLLLTNNYYIKKHHKNWLVIILSGAFIGFVNGFWGGGGGMICVPVLSNIFKLPEKKAHATAILVMLPLSLSSLVVYYFSGSIDWSNAAVITLGSKPLLQEP